MWCKNDRIARSNRQVNYYKDFIISLSVIDRSSIQNIIKDIVELNSIINQIDLIDIYEKLHPAAAEYRFFWSSHGTLTKTDLILNHSTHLNKFKRIGIIQSMLLDHNGINLEIHNRWELENPKYLEIKQHIYK